MQYKIRFPPVLILHEEEMFLRGTVWLTSINKVSLVLVSPYSKTDRAIQN